MSITDTEKPILGAQKAALSEAIDAAGLLSKALHKLQQSGIQADSDGFVDAMARDMSNQLLEISEDLHARKAFSKTFGVSGARRRGEITKRRAELESMLKNGLSGVERKRKTIMGTGVAESEAVRLIPDFDGSDIQAEIDEITDELMAWGRFYSSGLASDLPENAVYLRDNLPSWVRK